MSAYKGDFQNGDIVVNGSNHEHNPRQDVLHRVQRLSHLFDTVFRVPLIGVRIGLDGLIGMIPVLGDAVSGAVSLYYIALAHKAGFSSATKTKMLMIALIDFVLGLVPVIGDFADFFFKGHTKLADIMLRELERDIEASLEGHRHVYG